MSTLVESLGERLARRIDRRSALKGACVAGFGTVAAWAGTNFVGSSDAYAASCQATVSNCQCNPPGGRYCSTSQCSAENCAGGCSFAKDLAWSSTACWCTANCCNFNCSARGFYKCCDCRCGSTTCACAVFTTTCGPCGPACC
jgi:hypothetical protein